MATVLLQVMRENENVVQIDKYKRIQEVSKYVVDKALEDSGGVSELEWNHQIFLLPGRGVESNLPLLT
ncbi:hypothetical protein ABFV78_16285, partial [Brucella melitensis]